MTQEEFDGWRAAMSQECRSLADAVEERLRRVEGDMMPEYVLRVMIVNQTMREWGLK
jgi:hypothetical protein